MKEVILRRCNCGPDRSGREDEISVCCDCGGYILSDLVDAQGSDADKRGHLVDPVAQDVGLAYAAPASAERDPLVEARPDVCFGQPVIAGTRIRTDVVASRFLAGESITELKLDYGKDALAIEAAIRHEALAQRKPQPSVEEARAAFVDALAHYWNEMDIRGRELTDAKARALVALLDEGQAMTDTPDAPDAPSHESPWTQIIGGMPDFPDPDSVVTPAPDAPRVHCGGCHRTPWPPCPGVAPAPPALSAEEREALEVVVNCLCPEHRDEECVVPTRQETILRALLARTAEKP